jgi:uncharacterized protein (TIGR03066 family)
MKKIVLASAALLLAVVVTARAQEPKGQEDKGVNVTRAKLVGVWVPVKHKYLPAGATIEFTRDGKVKVKGKVKVEDKDKVIRLEGTYKIVAGGFKLTGIGPKGEVQTQTVTVTQLTATEMVTRSQKGVVNTFTKKLLVPAQP